MFLDESKITVDYECERLLSGWSPRRFGECSDLHYCSSKDGGEWLSLCMVVMYAGGGLGGCKGSGQLRFGGRDRPFRKPMCVIIIEYWKSYLQSVFVFLLFCLQSLWTCILWMEGEERKQWKEEERGSAREKSTEATLLERLDLTKIPS